MIRATAEWLAYWGYPSRIIVGSIRQVFDVQAAALARAHVITVPPAFLGKLLDHRYSRDTVRGFLDDGRKALSKMEAAGV